MDDLQPQPVENDMVFRRQVLKISQMRGETIESKEPREAAKLLAWQSRAVAANRRLRLPSAKVMQKANMPDDSVVLSEVIFSPKKF